MLAAADAAEGAILARDLLLAADDYPSLVGVDGMHLNEQGHAFLAEAVEERLPILYSTPL